MGNDGLNICGNAAVLLHRRQWALGYGAGNLQQRCVNRSIAWDGGLTDSTYSGIKVTVQFNVKIFYPRSENKPNLWCSDPVSNVDFSEDKTSFYAQDCAIELSEDGNSYTIKSAVNKQSIVNLKVTKVAPGFQIGVDGKTLYGTDLKNPWGYMRHAFWPRNRAEGTITTEEGTINLKGSALFIMAMQGMKPHHAAAKWTFANFQGPSHSAIMMEYTTPPSYGSSVVNIGGIIKDDKILYAGCSNTVAHSKIKDDPQNDWPEPEEVKFEWSGKTKDEKSIQAVLEGPLDQRLDKIDVMAEVPAFVKNIVAAAAGTKPYIYQVC